MFFCLTKVLVWPPKGVGCFPKAVGLISKTDVSFSLVSFRCCWCEWRWIQRNAYDHADAGLDDAAVQLQMTVMTSPGDNGDRPLMTQCVIMLMTSYLTLNDASRSLADTAASTAEDKGRTMQSRWRNRFFYIQMQENCTMIHLNRTQPLLQILSPRWRCRPSG